MLAEGRDKNWWRNGTVEARKFAVRVRKRYWRGGSPDSAARLRIEIERKAPRADLIFDDWIEFSII